MKQSKCKWVRLGDYIEQSDGRNSQSLYGLDAIKGISTAKDFIETKANMEGVSLLSYKTVPPSYYAYVPDTSRRGDKMALGFNNSNKTYLISSIYCVFHVTDTEVLLPEYLYLIYNRSEFDRYARFNSWGSAREVFTWEDMQNIRIPLPSIEEQQKVVNAWKAFREIKEQNEAIAAPLMQVCQSYIQELKHKYKKVEVGQFLSFNTEKNKDLEITLEQGLNIDKQFITPQRTNSDLSSRIKVRNGQFAYCTQLNNENVAIALREGPDCVVSPVYAVFDNIRKDLVLDKYLFLWFARPEFGRYVYWASKGSAYEFLQQENLCSYKIPIPSIEIQQAIVNIYNCANEAKRIAEEADRKSREVCPALIQNIINS